MLLASVSLASAPMGSEYKVDQNPELISKSLALSLGLVPLDPRRTGAGSAGFSIGRRFLPAADSTFAVPQTNTTVTVRAQATYHAGRGV